MEPSDERAICIQLEKVVDRETLGILFLVFITGSAFIGAFALIGNAIESNACKNYEHVTGKRTRHMFMDECYVETPAGWQRWDEYKLRAAASEGLKFEG